MTPESFNTTLRAMLDKAEAFARKQDTDTANQILDVIADMEEREDRRLWDTGQYHELRMREEARGEVFAYTRAATTTATALRRELAAE